MEENQNLVELYNALHKKGVTAASNVSEFKMLLDDEKNRQDMYDALNKKGVFSGTYDEFQTSIGYELNQQPAPARVDVSDVEDETIVRTEQPENYVEMPKQDARQSKYPFPSYYPQYRNDDANPSVEQKVKDDGFVVPSELTEENFKSVKQRRDELNKRLEEIGKSAQHLGQMGFMAPKEPLNALSEEAKKIRSELETIDGFIDSWNNTDESRAYLERQKQRVNDVSLSIDKAQEENNRNRINRQIERDSKLTFFGRLAKSLQAAENPITPEVVEALTDPTTNGLRAAKNEVRNADKQLQLEDMRRNGEMKGLAFIRGLETANYYELIPAIGMADAFAILDAKQALEEGRELNQSQQLLLEAMEARAEVDNAYQDNNTIWERLGRIAPEQLMFTAQFVVGAGVTGSTKVGERVAAKSAERAAVKYAKKGVKSSARRFIGGNVLPKLEGMAVSSAMQTFANPLGVAGMVEDFERRYAGDIYYDNEGNLHVFDNDRGAGKAAYQAIASAWIENFTEYAGENITKSAKLLDSKMFDIAGKFDNVIKRVGAGKIADVFSIPKQLGQITQIGSAPEEFLEEELGSVMNALFATDAESGESYGDSFKRTIGQSFSGEQQLETLLSCAITSMLLGGGGNAVNAVGNAGRRKQANRDVEQSKALLGKVKGISINELDNQIENGQIKDIASYLKQQSDANGWSQDEQGAAVSYVMNRTRQIGMRHFDDTAIAEAQQEMRRKAEDMANRWDGNIYNATWKDGDGNEQPVTIVNGRVHYNTRENGTIHFDPYTSSAMFAIRLADGTPKQVPSRTITGIQAVNSIDDQLQSQGQTIPQMMQAQFEQEGMAIPTIESVWGGNLVANETQFEDGKYTYLGQDENGRYAFANNDKRTNKDNPIVYKTERQLIEYGLSLNIQAANAAGDAETARQAQDDLDFMQHLDEITADATEKERWDVLKSYAKQRVAFDENGEMYADNSNVRAAATYLLTLSEGSFEIAISCIDESVAALAAQQVQQQQSTDISTDAAANAEASSAAGSVDASVSAKVDFYTNVRNILLEMQQGQQEAIEESLNEMPVSQMEVGQEFPVMYDGQQAVAVVVGKDADGRNVLTIRDQDGNDLESGIDDWEDEQWDAVRVKAEDSSVAEEPEPVGKGSFGYIYDQFRGKAKEAVEFLIKKKSGEAIGALSHRSVGEIDIVWGDEGTGKSDGFGLAKLVKYHPEVIGNLQELLDDMEVVSRSENRVNLESKTHKAGVRLDWDGVRKTWLMTMFEKKGASEPANGTTDITGNQSGLENDTAPFQNPDVSAGKDNANSDTTGGNGVKNSIPRDKDGNIAHASLDRNDAETYAAAVGEEADNAEAFAGMGDTGYISRNLDAAGKEVDKAEKRKPKATNASRLREELAEINMQRQSAKDAVAFWQAVDAELKRRQAVRLAERQAADDERHARALAEEEERKAEDARKKTEQEQLGANNVSDNIREKWNNSTKIEGNADEITLANGERIEGHYYLVESGSASASHDATEGFKKTEGFPVDENGQTVNDRDYEGDKNAQQITRTMAQNYDSRAAQEAPVVSQDGIVMSGNGRTMAGELAALNNTDGAYIEYLNKYPHKYGFTTEQVGGMSHPRVVFVPNERMPYTTDTFAKFNQQGMKGQSKTEQAVKLGKIVDDATFGRIIRSINRFDTLGDFYADSNATAEAIGELQKAGAINQMQHTEMFDGETISETGKQMLENMLIGKAFESNPDAVRQLAAYKSLRQSVITALAEISNNIALGEYSLEGELSRAIELAYNARSKGYKAGDKVSEFAGQTVLFAEDGATAADFTNATVMMLADLLNDNRVTRLKKALQVYNHQAEQSAGGQTDLFAGDVKTKQDILNEVLLLLQHGTESEQQQALDTAREQRKADAGREESVQQDGNAGESNQGERVSEPQQPEPTEEISDDEVESVISSMKEHAVTVPFVEITDNNWRNSVVTPIGEVKMGENQKEKLFAKGREQQYGMLLETLGNPDIILEERDKEENIFHERPSSYLFVKTFQKEDGTKYVHFESVTVSQEGMEISVSSHIIRENQLRNKVKSDRLLYKATALDGPAHPSAGQPTNEGVSLSSDGKDTEKGETKIRNDEKNNDAKGRMVPDNPLYSTAKEVSAYRDSDGVRSVGVSYGGSGFVLRFDESGVVSNPLSEAEKYYGGFSVEQIFGNEFAEKIRRAWNGEKSGNFRQENVNFLGRLNSDGTAFEFSERKTLADSAPLSLDDMRGETEQTKPTDEAVAAANEEVDTNPTEAQKEAGNYKKGHVKIDGFDISIENPAGSTRSGTDAQGNPWSVTMHNSYGYIRMTEGVDGDHIDIFLSDHIDDWNGTVYVVDQVNSDGSFDEHKVMYGFNSAEEAREAYLSNYSEGWQGLGTITGVSREEFKKWVDSSHRKTKAFADYKSVQTTEGQNEAAAPVSEENNGTDGTNRTDNQAEETVTEQPKESREELDKRLMEERKQRILAEGTSFDKPFGLIAVSDDMSVEDIEANAQRIISVLKANRGNGKFKSFEGFVYDGSYGNNAGHQVYGYLYALNGVVKPSVIQAWFDGHGFNGLADIVRWGRKQYSKAASAQTEAEETETPSHISEAIGELGIDLGQVHVVSDASQLPKDEGAAYSAIRRGLLVEGWYNPKTGEVYLYAPNLKSKERAKKVVLHELVSHKGLRGLLGKDGFDGLCDEVWKSMESKDAERMVAYVLYGDSGANVPLDEYARAVADIGTRRKAADEYMAHLSEKGIEASAWERFRNAIVNALRRLGFDIRMTDADIRRLLRESYGALKAEGQVRTEEAPSGNADGTRFSITDVAGYDRENGTELQRFLDFVDRGKKLSDGEDRYFTVGKTGEMLNRYGMTGYITIGANAFNKRHSDDIDHNLTSADWNSVVATINDPIVITQYRGKEKSYRLYTKAMINGRYIAVGVDVNSVGRNVEVTNIKTAFGSDLEKVLNNGAENLLYPSMDELKKVVRQSSTAPNSRLYAGQPIDAAKLQNIFGTDGFDSEKNDSDVRFSIVTPEMDAEYMDAVNNGDMDKAQRMVADAFKNAFPDTKVVDKNGKPLTLYHGTKGYFNVFRYNPDDLGFHFGDKKTARTRVGRGKDAKLMPVHVNITNPLVINDDLGAWDGEYLAEYMYKNNLMTEEEARSILMSESGKYRVDNRVATRKMRDFLRNKGIDGIVYENIYESDGKPSYLVFSQNQIKSADPVTYDNNGNIIPLSERFNPENNDIRFSITPQMDSDFRKAYEEGNTEKAAELVKQAAKMAMPNSAFGGIVFYHNTPNNFTIFDEEKNGTHNDAGWLGDGFYFYGIENEGNVYGKNKMKVFLNIENPYFATYEDNSKLAEQNNRTASIEYRKNLEDEGYDGVYYNGDLRQEAVAFYPNQIKSAEPFTFDDNGELIPLSERFNDGNDDIRFSINPETDAEYDNEISSLRDEKQVAFDAVMNALGNAGIEVVEATEEDVEKLKASIRSIEDSKGTVRGWVGSDGKIHLTKDGMNAETPIHEYTHLWAEALQMNNPELWEQIKGLLKGTPEWQRITSMKEYSNLKDDDRIAGEVLAHISGKKNAERMEAEAKRMIDEAPTLEEAAKAANLLGRMRDALKKFWTWVGKTLLGKKGNINIDQVSNMVMADLANGVNPFNPGGRKRKVTSASVDEDTDIESVNKKFNDELQQQIEGTLPAGHVYEMGMPSAYLRSTGVPNLPIRLQSSILNKKSNDPMHPYKLEEIRDLVKLIQKPLAIFSYGEKDKAQNLMIGISQSVDEGKQFLVGLSLSPTVNGKVLEINSVRNVFPKNYHDWIHWINQGKLLRVDDKENVKAIIDALRINPVDYISDNDLDSAAKVIENFENPQVEGENFSDADLSIDEGTDETDRTDVPEMSDEEAEQYDAGRMTFTEIATEGVIKAAEKNKEDLRMRNGAVKVIGVSLNRLRQAMAKQKEYDKATVDSIVRLARMMIDNGYMDNMSRSEVKRLMTLAKNATGKTDITKQANAVVDLMLKHQLKAAEAVQQKLLSTKGSKVNASGVEVQAGLDITGQRTVKAMKDGIELDEAALAERIADVNDRMGGTDKTLAANAAEEYEGLMMAKDYHDMIRQSEQDEAQLRHELDQAKEDLKNGTLGRKEYKELAARIDAALRKNMAERVTAFTRLNQQLAEVINGSKGRAREFREKQMERVREIQHNANSDMKGTPASEHKKAARINKAVNNDIVRYFMLPVATFDEMLRFFGKKSVDGMGYLWQRFMDGYTDAADTEWRSLKKDHDALDEKVSEVMGEKMRWSDLFSMERKMKPIDVEFYDTTTNEDGEAVRVKEKHPLTQGNALYIYMVNKMDDGAMKLRRMGITDEDVDRIAGQLDPRFLQLADWIQDEFLPKKREAFNAVHMRMFGAPMAAIEEYFPLVTNSRSRGKDEDISEHDKGETKPSTITGSIIKRTVNTTPLDVTNADAFDVLLGHLRDMEHWAAYAEFNRDLNTLLSYKRFKNQVLNTSSVRFGAGETLWNNFKDVCAIAAGVYRPTKARADKLMVNISKGVTSAKISFRLYTALKQLLSYPAYFSEANPVELAKSTGRPANSFNWALDNLPGFAERWQSRQAGDSRLKETDADWAFWKNKLVETAARWGMTPNAFVDGITVAMGAKAIYESKLKRYLKDGYSEAEAKEKALKEASAAVNETQQSSQNAYLSAMQLDRTVASVALTVFRNASMGYTRRLLRAVDNIKRKFTKGYKEESIEFMRKKMVREGLTEEQAKAASERAWNISIAKDVANVVIFGYVMQLAWNLGSSLMYLIFGDDDDEKERMWEDAALHALAGPVEGLSGGSIISELVDIERKRWQEKKKYGKPITSFRNYDFNLLPIMSDMQTIINRFEQDGVRGIQDIVNLVIQAGVGVNPQTITDAAVAIVDAADGDLGLGKEIGLCALRIMQVPQSQLDQLYIDELGMSAKDAKGLPMDELAQRYAAYKRMKDAPLTGWAYSDEAREKVDKRYVNKFVKLVQERVANMDDEALERNMDDNDDLMLKKQVGKEVASRLEGKDTYGNQPQSNWKEETKKAHLAYQQLRGYVDLCEDVVLQKAQADADKAYEAALEEGKWTEAQTQQMMAKGIEQAREQLNKMRRQLGQGNGQYDQQIMENIRAMRSRYMEYYGLKGKKE